MAVVGDPGPPWKVPFPLITPQVEEFHSWSGIIEQASWEGAAVPVSRDLYTSGLQEPKLGGAFCFSLLFRGSLCLGTVAFDCKVRKAEMQNVCFALSFPFSLEC